MARLSLMRPYDGGGAFRRLRLEVDGEEVARLRQYHHVDLDLPAGRHSVVARMDWVDSVSLDIDLADGEDLQLEVALPLMPMWDVLQRPRRALEIRRV